jgi:hypothetical protein
MPGETVIARMVVILNLVGDAAPPRKAKMK